MLVLVHAAPWWVLRLRAQAGVAPRAVEPGALGWGWVLRRVFPARVVPEPLGGVVLVNAVVVVLVHVAALHAQTRALGWGWGQVLRLPGGFVSEETLRAQAGVAPRAVGPGALGWGGFGGGF